MPSDGFLFVNPGDTSSSGHKASSSARAFVMRKARADQAWSTKSAKLVDRRKNKGREVTKNSKSTKGGDTSSRQVTRTTAGDKGKQPTVLRDKPRTSEDENLIVQYGGGKQLCIFCGRRCPTPSVKGMCVICRAVASGCGLAPQGPAVGASPDPFGSVAIVIDEKTSSLLSFFTRAICPQIAPIGGALQPREVQQHWLAPSFAHPAFMHAILCLTAVQLSIMQPDCPQYVLMAMYHRVRAIKAVQRNLQDPEQATSDANIAAVFNLLCVEENLFLPSFAPLARTHMRPDPVQRLAHLRGLREMVGMRGGIRGLGTNGALRSFLLRHTAVQAVASFEAPYLLPKGLTSYLYKYPASSPFLSIPCPMSSACRRLQIDEELIDLIKSAECLAQDTAAWISTPDAYTWHALDIQNLYSISIDTFVRWHIENESSLTATEGILSLCMIVFLAYLCRRRQTVSSPLPPVLLRLKQHFDGLQVRNILLSSGLDTWAAVIAVLASEGHPDFEDHFFQIYLDTLANHDPTLRTFDDLKESLKSSIWSSRPMDMYAWEVWTETPEEWKEPRPGMQGTIGRRLRRCQQTVTPASALSTSNPYTNGHPNAHVSIKQSAYNL